MVVNNEVCVLLWADLGRGGGGGGGGASHPPFSSNSNFVLAGPHAGLFVRLSLPKPDLVHAWPQVQDQLTLSVNSVRI